MTIKIVTDSTSDLPPQLSKDLSITVVPLYLRFGENTYRDRIDIGEDEFYKRLQNDPIHPTTSQPTPQDFADVYRDLSQQADGILSIHISRKMSGTCNSALQAKEMMPDSFPVEVLDSKTVSMGLGLLAIEAANIAKSGRNLHEVVEEVKTLISNTHVWALFDTLKYLVLGGRIGKAKGLVGTILNIKPLLIVKDGEMAPVSQPRTRSRGIDLMYDSVCKVADIQNLSVVYSTTPDEAQELVDRISGIYDRRRIRLARLGPALGVHAGPGALEIAVMGKKTP
jgi:DegV family protein with EDD domain